MPMTHFELRGLMGASPAQMDRDRLLAKVPDILHGNGSYVPSSEAFKNVTLRSLLSRTDLAFGDPGSTNHLRTTMAAMFDEIGESRPMLYDPVGADDAVRRLEEPRSASLQDREIANLIGELLDYVNAREHQYFQCEVKTIGLLEWLSIVPGRKECLEDTLRPIPVARGSEIKNPSPVYSDGQ